MKCIIFWGEGRSTRTSRYFILGSSTGAGKIVKLCHQYSFQPSHQYTPRSNKYKHQKILQTYQKLCGVTSIGEISLLEEGAQEDEEEPTLEHCVTHLRLCKQCITSEMFFTPMGSPVRRQLKNHLSMMSMIPLSC